MIIKHMNNYDDPSYGEEIRVLPKLRIDPKYTQNLYLYSEFKLFKK